jgi:hypothetical protein
MRSGRRTLISLRVVGFAALCALIGLPIYALSNRPSAGGIYTVAQIVTGATLHPSDWDGRVVRVRALASLSLQTVFRGGALQGRPVPQVLLVSVPDGRPGIRGQDGMIQLLITHEDGVLGLLRRLPFLGAAVPPPQVVSMTHSETYQIQLQLASRNCNFSPCIAATLPDAAPVSYHSLDLPYGM